MNVAREAVPETWQEELESSFSLTGGAGWLWKVGDYQLKGVEPDLLASVGRATAVDRVVGQQAGGGIRDASCGRSADANREKRLYLAHGDQGVTPVHPG